MKDLYTIPKPPSRQELPKNAAKVFQGEIFAVHQWQQPMYDGSTATFEKLSRNDTVGVLAVTADKKIIVTEQEQPSMKPFISLIGGIMDSGERPFDTAQRELKEEAGAEAGSWDLWFTTQPMSKIDWAIYMFIAKGCKLSEMLTPDPGEKIKLRLVDFDEFLTLIFDPEFRDFEVTTQIARLIAHGEIEEFKTALLGD